MFHVEHIDRNIHLPTLVGDFGASWEIDPAKLKGRNGKSSQDNGTVATAIVFAPWANIAWAYYFLSIVHLRREPGLPEPIVKNPEATHEIVLAAMDPRQVPSLEDPAPCCLRPLNYAGQFKVAARPNPVDLDAAAVEIMRATVFAILRGELNPDTDYLRQWRERFGSHLVRHE